MDHLIGTGDFITEMNLDVIEFFSNFVKIDQSIVVFEQLGLLFGYFFNFLVCYGVLVDTFYGQFFVLVSNGVSIRLQIDGS